MTTRADELVAAYVAMVPAVVDPARAPALDPALVRELANCAGWGTRDIRAPLLPSGISHGVPWGLSCVAGTREVRVFVEPQADPATPASYWAAAARVTAFAAACGADIALLDELARDLSLALPRPARVWHAIAPVDGGVRWHAYITCPDPLEVLRRAGIAPPPLRPRDRITIVSLDLAPRPRIKAYVLMPDAAPADLAIHTPDGPAFARAMLGERAAWWLVAVGNDGTTALHFPARHLDPETARARARALAPDLRDGVLHYVSFQRRAGAPRITTYFTPQVRR